MVSSSNIPDNPEGSRTEHEQPVVAETVIVEGNIPAPVAPYYADDEDEDDMDSELAQ